MLIDRYEQPNNAAGARADHHPRALLEQHLSEPEDWHGVIRRQVMAAVVHYSTAIEGNVLHHAPGRVDNCGRGDQVPQKDRTEALNYFRAMRWAQTRSQDPSWRMTHETILTLHFMVGTELGADYEPLGQYRHGQNNVQDRRTGEPKSQLAASPCRGPRSDERVRRVGSPAIRRGTSPYVENALAHLNLVAIHPFSDGNGRVGRLMCSLLRIREGYKAQAFWSLEQYLGEHALSTGQCLRRYSVRVGRRIVWSLRDGSSGISPLSPRRSPMPNVGCANRSPSSVRWSLASSTRSIAPSDPRILPRTVIPVWLAIVGGSVTRRQLPRYLSVSDETQS